MRKHYMLIVSLILVSLLLTGCLGRTSTKYVYDGSPTALEVVIKRDAVEPMALSVLSDEPEQLVQVRLWMDNDAGETIYQTSQTVPLRDITDEGYTMARQVPADRGYSVLAIYSDNQGYFEVAQQKQINAPAGVLTTSSVELIPVEYEIVIPDKMYSGGTMNQFKIVFPEEFEYLFDYGIYYSNAPWTTNGPDYYAGYSAPSHPRDVYQTNEPLEVYYQWVIHLNPDCVNAARERRSWIPNLEYESELPTFWVYPHPGWTE